MISVNLRDNMGYKEPTEKHEPTDAAPPMIDEIYQGVHNTLHRVTESLESAYSEIAIRVAEKREELDRFNALRTKTQYELDNLMAQEAATKCLISAHSEGITDYQARYSTALETRQAESQKERDYLYKDKPLEEEAERYTGPMLRHGAPFTI